jgi:hypothetical protein
MERRVKGYWILESEIEELKAIFYTEIGLDVLSIALMGLCFYIWFYAPSFFLWSIIGSVLSLVFAAAGVYLSVWQSRIWRRIKEATTEAILEDTDT